MRLLVLGRGRMGSLVASLAAEYGFDVVAVLGRPDDAGPPAFPEADVAIDFTLAEAVPVNLPRLAERGIDAVIGTTGWQAHAPALRALAAARGIGVVAAPNFSIGMHLFQRIVSEAARLAASQADMGAWIHERHHDRKQDAPSGTALALAAAMAGAGFSRRIDMSSARAGFIPGTHTVGFDAPSETIELTHTVRDRAVFARGALVAARWVRGRRGWFGMDDVIGQGRTPDA